VHLGAGSWKISFGGQVNLHELERELTDALDLVLQSVLLRRGKESRVGGLTRTEEPNSAATHGASHRAAAPKRHRLWANVTLFLARDVRTADKIVSAQPCGTHPVHIRQGYEIAH
jgi:hypothetical protein